MSIKSKISFIDLNHKDFEHFCKALLRLMGFVNIDWKQGGRDRGRDLTCDLVVEEHDGSKHIQQWFVECKHYNDRAISVSDLQSKIAWADANNPDYLLIIVSSYLSNDSKDWLKSIEKRKTYQIRYWEAYNLIEFLDKYPILKEIYFENRNQSNFKNLIIRNYIQELIEEFGYSNKKEANDNLITLNEILGNPPDKFLLTFKTEQLVSVKDNKFFTINEIDVELSIPEDYPNSRSLPTARVLTNILHPHLRGNSPICYGYRDPFISLKSFAHYIFLTLNYNYVCWEAAMDRDPKIKEYYNQRTTITPNFSLVSL